MLHLYCEYNIDPFEKPAKPAVQSVEVTGSVPEQVVQQVSCQMKKLEIVEETTSSTESLISMRSSEPPILENVDGTNVIVLNAKKTAPG